MKNKDQWVSSKFEFKGGKWRGSRNPTEVAVGSRLMTDLIAHYFHSHLQDYCKGYLVDLGCGNVPLYGMYRNYISNNICIDWGHTLHKCKYLDVESNISDKLPIADGVFDTAILSDVLEHIPEPEQLWTEIHRILKPNGMVFVSVPFMYGIHEEPYDYYRYTVYGLRRLAEKTGFTVKILHTMGGGPEVMANLAAKILKYLPWFGNILGVFIQSLTELLVKRTARVPQINCPECGCLKDGSA